MEGVYLGAKSPQTSGCARLPLCYVLPTMSNLWPDAFYSDPHFGHKNIIDFCHRPFSSVQDMTDELISRYNRWVGPDDTVIWCGDCFFTRVEEAEEIMSELNGTKLLVRGNHDRSASRMAKLGFSIVVDELRMCIDGVPVRVNHYPYAGNVMSDGKREQRYLDRRPPRIKGEVLVHGHTHDTKRRRGNQIHVGVDAWDYAPALMSEVQTLVQEVFE